MALHVKELVAAVEGFKTPYVLIDTPGRSSSSHSGRAAR